MITRMIKLLLTLVTVTWLANGQCQKVIFDPLIGDVVCVNASGSAQSISACAATPPTAGAANVVCYDTAGVLQKCNNGASACTTAGQWVAQGGVFTGADASGTLTPTGTLWGVTTGAFPTMAQAQASIATKCVSTGSNPYTGTVTPAITSYSNGAVYQFIPAASSTGAVTLDCGLGTAKKVMKNNGTTQVTTGELIAAVPYILSYNSALDSAAGAFVITGMSTSGAGTVTASGTPTQYAIPVWTSATDITKIAPSAQTTYPMFSAGSSANPAFRAIADGDIPSAITRTIALGTATLGTSLITANACASVVTVTATGTVTTDVIISTANVTLSGVTGYGKGAADGLIIYPYPTVGNVNFEVCNATGSSITPGAATLNWRVVR